MVNLIMLVADKHGVLQYQEGYSCNEAGHKIDASGNVIAEIVVDENAKVVRQTKLGDCNRPDPFFAKRSAN